MTSASVLLPEEVLGPLARTPRLLVCCDYDGTLAEIVSDPADAHPHPMARTVLEGLAALPSTTVALVSGRSRADLASLSGSPHRVLLVGGHGWESADDAALDVHEAASHAAVLDACRRIVSGVSGARLEVKPASVAVHVRQASRGDAARVVDAVMAGPARIDGVKVLPGKEVVELAVVDADKGRAVRTLQVRSQATATLFLGDDVTDEAAFAVLGADDVGVKVGEGPTAARHRVGSPAAAVDLLAELADRRRRWMDRTSTWQDA